MSGINSNVVLMLHGDGEDGGAVIIDSISGRTATRVNTPTTVSALKKFGQGAIRFSKLNGISLIASYRLLSAFGIDYQIAFSVLPTTTSWQLVAGQGAGYNTSNRWHIWYYMASATMQLALYANNPDGGSLVASISVGAFSVNTFKHIAIQRTDTLKFFVDGISQTPNITGNQNLSIGVSAQFFLGQISGTTTYPLNEQAYDEFRIVNGVAVWTEDFTPPTEAYSPDIPTATLQVTQETSTRIERTYASVPEATVITPIPYPISDAPFELSISATANVGQICNHIVTTPVVLEFTWLSPNAGVPTTGDITADIAPIEATWTPILTTVDPIVFPLPGLQAHKVMDVELSPITLNTSARVENPWKLNVTLERVEGALAGRQDVYGSINKNIRPITMSAESVYVHILGQINGTLNPIYLAQQMHAETWKAWSLAATLENITLSATGHQDVYGSIAQDLQNIGADIEIDSLVFEIIAMNLLNKAVTNFSNYPFNSFCYFNGKHYGCARDGIYELDGITDYGTDIASYIKTGLLDLEVTALQRIRHAYLGFKSSGILTLTITTDDGLSYSYSTENLTSNYQGQKVKFGKGFKDRYFQLKIANTDGCTFAIDKTRVFDEPISHRKR